MTPTKLDLLKAWLPSRSWFSGDIDSVTKIAAYRFDDPAGEVGLEGLVLTTGDGSTFHVPLTYRAAPLPGGEAHFVGNGEHSALGTRWIYDGCGDPVWVAQLCTTILKGGTQADEVHEEDGQVVRREPTMTVRGSGHGDVQVPTFSALDVMDEDMATTIRAGDLDIVVARRIGLAMSTVEETLVGQWADAAGRILAGTIAR